tara:strand:- start:778 stop:984 length:207 start_codon:yes stop_codon:yes gene_type:complete
VGSIPTVSTNLKINKMIDLHEQAIDLMLELDEKYKMDNTLSLDEFLYEYKNILNKKEIKEINNLINKF